MNVEKPITQISGALTDKEANRLWNSISWRKVYEFVNRYQIRIAKAVRNQRWNLVKKLQYQLTHSYYAIVWAVRRVTTNQGRRTAGVDGERWETPYAKISAVRMILRRRKYEAEPLLRVYIPKFGRKGKRPLSIPTMYDRTMQALHALVLYPVAETTADWSSFGFRYGRSAHDARERIFSCLSQETSPKWILEGDIKACFDEINHNWLLKNVIMDKSVLTQFLKSGFIYEQELFPTYAGTPQGGIISPILANITLDGMEAAIVDQHLPEYQWRQKKVHFIRYADDFIVVAKDEEILSEIRERIRQFLKERGLELSEEKTKITNIKNGFDFLGWNFRKFGGKLIIKPSKKSINNVIRKISDEIKHAKAKTQEDLIDTLNPVVTGWANYHKTVVAAETFQKLDHKIWNMLWRWAKRRHRKDNKSKEWIVRRYWDKVGNRKWVFSTKEKKLKLFTEVKIRRHPKLKRSMNPYLDQEYFATRKTRLRELGIDSKRSYDY